MYKSFIKHTSKQIVVIYVLSFGFFAFVVHTQQSATMIKRKGRVNLVQ